MERDDWNWGTWVMWKLSAVETLGISFYLMMDLFNHIMLENGAKLEMLFLKTLCEILI